MLVCVESELGLFCKSKYFVNSNLGVKVFLISLVAFVFLSCNNKKLTEVVDVPLPEVEQKTAIMGVPDDVKANEGSFQLEKLPYSYDALVPNISGSTMENHYSKHYMT